MRNWGRVRGSLRVGYLAAFVASALAASTSAAPAAPVCKGERLALVVGDKAYPDIAEPLAGPAKAAKRIADALRDVGFDVDVGEDLTKARTDAAVRALLAKIKPGAAVFLFFSGFGVQAHGHTYLLPVDASIWSEADIVASGLDIDRLLSQIEEKKAAVEVLVIDAARRNPFERRFRASGSAGLAPPRAMSGNLVALFSAPPNKVFDASDLSAEPFADDVAREISAPHATAQEAFRQVRALVSRTSRAGQIPWGFTTLNYDLPLDVHDCSSTVAVQPRTQPQVAEADAPPHKADAAKAEAAKADAAKADAAKADAAKADAAKADAAKADAAKAEAAKAGAAETDPKKGEAAASPPSGSPAQPPAAKPEQQAMVTPPAPPALPSPDDKARTFQVALKDTTKLEETRNLLFEQDLDPGAVGSDKMRDAIQAFERRESLPDSAQPSEGLLEALRAAKSLAPWGAITVSDDIKRWGMSWSKPTRSLAVAEAKSRCGSDKCSQDLSFHGQGCGAFALSSKQWIVSHRDGGEAARKAALSDCGKGGAACRVIGSVCADGSDKTD